MKLTSAQELDELLTRLNAALNEDLLQIVAGSLRWDDFMDCTLTCKGCGMKFHLECETYHGAGGTFQAVL